MTAQSDAVTVMHAAGVLRDTQARLSDAVRVVADQSARELLERVVRSVGTDSALLQVAASALVQPSVENGETGHERPPTVGVAATSIYDQRVVTDRGRDNIKWYSPQTTLGDRTGSSRRTRKRGICFHHTAVRGGFGVHRSRVEHWEDAGVHDAPLVHQPDKTSVTTRWRGAPSDLASWARAMALADRYRGFPTGPNNTGVPYHVISAANRVLYLNLPFDWVTWHGDGSNTDFLGFAWDALSTRDALPENVLLDHIGAAMDTARSEGHFADGCEWTMHCAWTRKPDDAGRAFAEMLVANAQRFGATIRVDFKASPTCTSIQEALRR